MFEHIKKIKGNVLAIAISGEITGNEHGRLDRLIEQRAAEWERIRILVVLKHYPSFNSAESLYEDLRMVVKHSDHVDRLAVVGDRLWKRTWVGLFGLFGRIETDYFEMGQIDAAYRWVTQ
jgi:hypothetical protein